MKKSLYIILVFFICQSSFSQEKEVIFLDSNFNNVNKKNRKGDLVIRTGKPISQLVRRMIYYYVEFERDMNGKVINEVKLYIPRRKLVADAPNPYETKYIEVADFYKPEKRRGTIVGSGFVSKINADNFTNSIFKGQWREFYVNGNLKKIIPYDENGIKNGIYEEYFDDGEPNKKINYVNEKIISTEYNINLNYNLKYFSDQDYIKAYIEKDGIDKLEGLYECRAHIPIRGRNLRATYKIAIVSSKKHISKTSNTPGVYVQKVSSGSLFYIAYVLEANCEDCSEWEKGYILALFEETESGEFEIYWNHPENKNNNNKQIKIPPKDNYTKPFGSTAFTQVFLAEAIAESNKKLIFNIESEYIKDLDPKPFNDDESVILDRIWPESDIVFSIFSNQENDSNKDNITREKAIVLLKELKELLDLGLITEEEFVKQSEELKKKIFIKN